MKNIISIMLICLFLFPKSLLAQENNNWDYEHVSTGELVPYNGFLFSEDGMINVITKMEARLKQLEVDKDKEKNKIVLDYQLIIKNKEAEYNSTRELYQKQLDIREEVIHSYRRQAYWNNIKLAGGIIGGLACGYLVFKLTSLK